VERDVEDWFLGIEAPLEARASLHRRPPDLAAPVPGGEQAPIGAELDALDLLGEAQRVPQGLLVGKVPEPHRLVASRGREHPPVGACGHAEDAPRVAPQRGSDWPPAPEIP
jgi:hypothetical protein